MMRNAMKWIRRHWMIVAGSVAVIAVGVAAIVVVNSNRPPTGYAAGTVKEPGTLGETFRQADDQGVPWRWGALTSVVEVLPPNDGNTGRCYISVGWIETTRAGFANVSSADRSLVVSYYNNGALIPTGDAASACDIGDFLTKAEDRGFTDLESITETAHPLPQFYTVTYFSEDVRPDYVALTPTPAEMLRDLPASASVYWFIEEPVYFLPTDITRVFYDGDGPFSGRPGH